MIFSGKQKDKTAKCYYSTLSGFDRFYRIAFFRYIVESFPVSARNRIFLTGFDKSHNSI